MPTPSLAPTPKEHLASCLKSWGWPALGPETRLNAYAELAQRGVQDNHPEVHEAILARLAEDQHLLSLHATSLFQVWSKTRQSGPIVQLRMLLDQNPSIGWGNDQYPLNMALMLLPWAPALISVATRLTPPQLADQLLTLAQDPLRPDRDRTQAIQTLMILDAHDPDLACQKRLADLPRHGAADTFRRTQLRHKTLEMNFHHHQSGVSAKRPRA